eukprot:1156331-Pelagomonas_calceolata.AAC.6
MQHCVNQINKHAANLPRPLSDSNPQARSPCPIKVSWAWAAGKRAIDPQAIGSLMMIAIGLLTLAWSNQLSSLLQLTASSSKPQQTVLQKQAEAARPIQLSLHIHSHSGAHMVPCEPASGVAS